MGPVYRGSAEVAGPAMLSIEGKRVALVHECLDADRHTG
jgi:hypothetical protein